jgi:hypothetical protein
MTGLKWAAGAATAALLCGCDMKLGGDDEDKADAAASSAPASAEGKAEDGKFAIKAPGFDLSVDLPKGMTDRAKVDQDGRLLYPGSKISGLYVAGGASGEGGEVELRFNSADPPERIAAWYKDPARAADFKLDKAAEKDGGYALSGREAEGKQDFKLRLAPKAGGTDGRLTLRDRG